MVSVCTALIFTPVLCARSQYSYVSVSGWIRLRVVSYIPQLSHIAFLQRFLNPRLSSEDSRVIDRRNRRAAKRYAVNLAHLAGRRLKQTQSSKLTSARSISMRLPCFEVTFVNDFGL